MTGEVDVSVILPVYNRAGLLPGALDAVRAQTARLSYEVIVVDDCSTDGSGNVAEGLGARTLRLAVNSGPGASRDAGLGAARGRWSAFIDSDDRWAPDHLATLWAARDGHGLVASSALTIIKDRLRTVGSPYPWPITLRQPSDVLRPENVIPTSGCMVDTTLARDRGGFGAGRHAEDLEMWMRLLTVATGTVLPGLTVAYRSHAGQLSHTAEMAPGSGEALARLSAAGLLDAPTSAALRALQAWDERHLEGGRRGVVAGAVFGRLSTPRLAVALLGRASCRSRWRLQASRARRIAQLLS